MSTEIAQRPRTVQEQVADFHARQAERRAEAEAHHAAAWKGTMVKVRKNGPHELEAFIEGDHWGMRPHYVGSAEVDGVPCWVSAWVRKKGRDEYLVLRLRRCKPEAKEKGQGKRDWLLPPESE
jgi:hypothetical protein